MAEQDDSATVVAPARTAEDLDVARGFMRAFVAWARALSARDAALVDMYFEPEAFERELAALPGRYAEPSGRLLIASRGGRPVGCAALRDLGGGICEMKRMYVEPDQHGKGVGRLLAERLIAEARAAGYRSMRLDTSRNQLPAIALYEKLGFRRIPAYYPVPAEFEGFLLYFERALGRDPSPA